MTNGTSKGLKRVLAGVLTAATVLSFGIASIVRSPQTARAASAHASLYTREADKPTMDSYLHSSLGGAAYTQFFDGAITPVVRNVYGTRYAGEVWADKTVFARYSQPSYPEIRPFEANYAYSALRTVSTSYSYDGGWKADEGSGHIAEIDRPIQTLHYWLGLGNINHSASAAAGEFGEIYTGLGEISSEGMLRDLLSAGGLTDSQASMLNRAINDKIAEAIENGTQSYRSNTDGVWDGETLYLGKMTDGFDGIVSLADTDADFLHVYSVLESTMETKDAVPLDVVFVMDITSSMGNATSDTSKVTKAVDALNASIDYVLRMNTGNRVGVVVFAVGAYPLMPLDSGYKPIDPDIVNATKAETGSQIDTTGNVYVQISGFAADDAGAHTRPIYQATSKSGTLAEISTSTTYYGSIHNNAANETPQNVGTLGDEWPDVGFLTNVDAGFWTGMGMLATSDGISVQLGDGSWAARSPAMIFLGDGDPMMMMEIRETGNYGVDGAVTGTNSFQADMSGYKMGSLAVDTRGRINNGSWWAPYDPTTRYTVAGSWGAYHNPSIITGTALRAALMKTAVNDHYKAAADRKSAELAGETVPYSAMQFFTVGVDLLDTNDHNNYGRGWFTTRALLDPANYMKSEAMLSSEISGYKDIVDGFIEAHDFTTLLEPGQQSEISSMGLRAWLDDINEQTDKKDNEHDNLNALLQAIRSEYGMTLTSAEGGSVDAEHEAQVDALSNELRELLPAGFNSSGRFTDMMQLVYNLDAGCAGEAYDMIQEVLTGSKGDSSVKFEEKYDGAYPLGTAGRFNPETLTENIGRRNPNYHFSTFADHRSYGEYDIPGDNITFPIELKGGGMDVSSQDTTVAWSDVKRNSNYVDAFIYAENADQIADALDQLVRLIANPTFSAVSGTNDAGAEGSVTYSDPIGDYMEIDDVPYISMFGSLYRLEPVVVSGTSELSYQQALQYLPQFAIDSADAAKQAGAKYTIYRIAAEINPDTGDDIYVIDAGKTSLGSQDDYMYDEASGIWSPVDMTSRTRWNSSYAHTTEAFSHVFDLHEDIHIWVEDTGSLLDSTMWSGMSSAYSKCLYINIDEAAIPAQAVAVTLAADGFGGYRTTEYEMNMSLDEPEKSVPLRVYYYIGMDHEYLYYSGGSDRLAATGVRVSAMDADYLKENTRTDFRGHEGRYTAFYSNYYTDEEYTSFAALSDTNKTSRGNASVTFSAGEGNQFYRFSKDRPLFIIPGTFGLEERPSEIFLGSLTSGIAGFWVDTAKEIIGRSTESVLNAGGTPEKLDPNNYDHLLVWLNAMRANINWDGDGAISPEGKYDSGTRTFKLTDGNDASAYWRFGDCRFVEGRILSKEEIHEYYDTRKLLFPISEYPDLYDSEGKDILHEQLEANLAEESASNAMPEISSNNWYYIVREYYEPRFSDEGAWTGNVSVRYVAIPRKGSELGTGIGSGAEEFVRWFSPNYGAWYANYLDGLNGAAPQYSVYPYGDINLGVDGAGKPGTDGTVIGADGLPVYTGSEINWVVSVMPGGIRVGGMANFAGVKGYDIREGVNDGTFTGDGSRIISANMTETARTYFLPTIAGAATGSAVIDVYLGNNGRVLVPQAMLLIAKFVERADENGDLSYDIEDGTEFAFEVYIEGFTGEHAAVKTTYDPVLNRWRRVLESISIRTDENGYAVAAGRNDDLAEVGYNPDTGRVVADGHGYHVKFTGLEGANSLTEAYHYDDMTDTVMIGSKVEYNDSIVFRGGSGFLMPIGDGEPIEIADMPVATLLPDDSLGDETANAIVSSPYGLQVAYAAERYDFGDDGIATFYLTSGDGRLFNTVENNSQFSAMETLTEEQLEGGWHFVRGSASADGGERKFEFQEQDEQDGDLSYFVQGDVGTGEAVAHFINSADLTLTVSKTLSAAEGTEITAADRNTPFEFVLSLDSPDDSAGRLSYGYSVYENGRDEPIREGHLVGRDVSGHEDDPESGYVDVNADVTAENNSTWQISLKADQTMTLYGLRDGMSWSWKVIENPMDGYVPDDEIYEKDGVIDGTASGTAAFHNIKLPPDPVVIMRLDAMKQVDAPVDFDASGYEFEFTLTPVSWPDGIDAGNVPMPANSTVKITGPGRISFGEMEFDTPGEYSYRITETAGGAEGFTYDLTPKTVTFTVYENYIDGVYQKELAIDGLDDDNIYDTGETFVNKYNDGIEVSVWGTKQVESEPAGAAVLLADMFSFKLEALDGAPMPEADTAKNDIDGIFRFGPIKFKSAGTYKYKITEIAETKPGWEYDSSEWTVEITIHDAGNGVLSCGEGDIKYSKADGAAGAMIFVNKFTADGDLRVTKTVSGENADLTREFHFAIILDDRSINGVYGDMTFEDGVASIVLKHNESKTATGLPAGVKYTVSEAEADEDGYVTSSEGETGTIPAGGMAEAKFDNIMQEPGTGSLIVSKTVSGIGGDQSKEFSFTVTLSDTSINGKYGDMEFENGVAVFKLKHGESMRATGLPADVSYKVVETDFDGYEQRVTGDSGVIRDGGVARARFENIRLLGDLEITKTVAGTGGELDREFRFTLTLDDKTINGKYGDLEFKDGVAEFTLKHGEKKMATGLPAGVKYTITEAEIDHYEMTSTNASGEIALGDKITVAFTNTRLTGGFDVTKTVGGSGGERDRLFKFTIKLDDTTISGKFGDVEFSNGAAVINLKHGETASVTGLPAGIKYEITEEDVSGDGYVTTQDGASGVVPADGMAHSRFVNRKDDQITGDLEVSKTVIGDAGSRTKKFTFTIALSDTGINGKYGDMEFKNGVAEIKLAHGESAIATGLPAGIRYSVREEDVGDYDVSYSGANGTIPDSGVAYAVFVNAKWEEDDLGNLMVSKTARGGPGGKWRFEVILSDTSINGRYGDMRFRDGVAEFELGSGETMIARGLPAGVRYTVVELDANTGGYTTTSYGTTGSISGGKTAHAEFINAYESSGIRIYKYVSGTGGESFRKWLFTVTLSDKNITGDYGDMHFENGVAQVRIAHGESKQAMGLPPGVTYTVIEADANKDGYETSSTGEAGVLLAGQTAIARFTNHRDIDLPGKPTPPDNPSTGDGRPWGPLFMLLIICGAALPVVIWKSRDRKKPVAQGHHITRHTRTRRSK